MPDLHSALMIAVIALVTAALRFLPFWIFRENRKSPPLVSYLGQVLPFSIMGMLVVYCLKDISLTHAPSEFRKSSAVHWSHSCTSGSGTPC